MNVMNEKTIPVRVQTALAKPSRANLNVVREFWLEVLDEVERDPLYRHRPVWYQRKVEERRAAVVATSWKRDINNETSWRMLGHATSELVSSFRYYDAAVAVCARAQEEVS